MLVSILSGKKHRQKTKKNTFCANQHEKVGCSFQVLVIFEGSFKAILFDIFKDRSQLWIRLQRFHSVLNRCITSRHLGIVMFCNGLCLKPSSHCFRILGKTLKGLGGFRIAFNIFLHLAPGLIVDVGHSSDFHAGSITDLQSLSRHNSHSKNKKWKKNGLRSSNQKFFEPRNWQDFFQAEMCKWKIKQSGLKSLLATSIAEMWVDLMSTKGQAKWCACTWYSWPSRRQNQDASLALQQARKLPPVMNNNPLPRENIAFWCFLHRPGTPKSPDKWWIANPCTNLPLHYYAASSTFIRDPSHVSVVDPTLPHHNLKGPQHRKGIGNPTGNPMNPSWTMMPCFAMIPTDGF